MCGLCELCGVLCSCHWNWYALMVYNTSYMPHVPLLWTLSGIEIKFIKKKESGIYEMQCGNFGYSYWCTIDYIMQFLKIACGEECFFLLSALFPSSLRFFFLLSFLFLISFLAANEQTRFSIVTQNFVQPVMTEFSLFFFVSTTYQVSEYSMNNILWLKFFVPNKSHEKTCSMFSLNTELVIHARCSYQLAVFIRKNW